MTAPVKGAATEDGPDQGHRDGTDGTRPYDASGRRATALATRRTILEAARALVEEMGYSATTVTEVARRAAVSPESIYKGFGTKAGLIKSVFDITIAGDDGPESVAERPGAALIRAEPDVRVKLALYAAGAAETSARSARLQLALRNGAASDPAIAKLWKQLQAERLTGMTMLARHLVATGQLRTGVDVDHTRDVLWACIAVEVFDLFVHQRRWPLRAYADWLKRTLVASLVDE